uniref:Flavin-containing monooxygenase n=1 Tax=Rhabditophanes sp. KR3021 TaxID=114890 RepID=A0AC35U479_9BILA
MAKTVLIIGAGASGLPSTRHALLNGFTPVVLEATCHVGGLWRYNPLDEDQASVMKTTVINTSKEMTAYSDFPPMKDLANFMHNTEMYKYLSSYAEHFDLLQYIKFNHRVVGIKRHEDFIRNGKWVATYLDDKSQTKEETFDAVLLCTGHHKIPHWPAKWPGQDKFKGTITHAHSYKDHKGHEDKKVVVVGVGNSGGDIAVELSRIASSVHLVTRRGTWVFNRIFDYGIPFDLVLSTRMVFLMRHITPTWVSNSVLESKLTKRFDHALYGLQPKHRVLNAHPTVNDELPNRLACGMVKIKPNIKHFTENGIVFENDTKLENVDEVIVCTGYSFEFKLIEDGKLIPVVENEVSLYKYMYPSALADHNTLAVIGLIQPYGSIMPISEMQARLFFENLAGTCHLPSKSEMDREIAFKKAEMAARYYGSRRHTIQVDYLRFMDEIADIVGCKPDISALLFSDYALFKKVLFGPNVPYVYRLNGNNKWNGAREAIMTVRGRVEYPTKSARDVVVDKVDNFFVHLLSKNIFPVILIGFVMLIYYILKAIFSRREADADRDTPIPLLTYTSMVLKTFIEWDKQYAQDRVAAGKDKEKMVWNNKFFEPYIEYVFELTVFGDYINNEELSDGACTFIKTTFAGGDMNKWASIFHREQAFTNEEIDAVRFTKTF